MPSSRSPVVQVQGAAQLRASLRRAGSDLGDLRALHATAAAIAAQASAALTPARSGALRASVRSSGTKTAGILRAGRASVPYAGPIHWGWPRRGIRPSLFLSQGAQDSEGAWLPVYRQGVDHIVERIHGA